MLFYSVNSHLLACFIFLLPLEPGDGLKTPTDTFFGNSVKPRNFALQKNPNTNFIMLYALIFRGNAG